MVSLSSSVGVEENRSTLLRCFATQTHHVLRRPPLTTYCCLTPISLTPISLITIYCACHEFSITVFISIGPFHASITMPPEFGPPRPPSSSSAAPQANRDANAAAFAAAREYAFAHGLARDHLAIDPFEIAHRNMQRTSELIDNKAWLAQDFGKLFDDGSEGASRIFRDILHQMREVMQQKVDKQAKLKVPKGSLLLLQQASELWEYCQSEKVVADARAEIREVSPNGYACQWTRETRRVISSSLV